ncbi:hypothetical protein J6590_076543 [Homalodisca vitripennis]|nr:hypothetical protein J6590_076543 [Homalodisca vitripennis]
MGTNPVVRIHPWKVQPLRTTRGRSTRDCQPGHAVRRGTAQTSHQPRECTSDSLGFGHLDVVPHHRLSIPTYRIMAGGIPLRDGDLYGFGTIYLRKFFKNEVNMKHVISPMCLLSSLIRHAIQSALFKPVTSCGETGPHVYWPHVDSDGNLLIANRAGLEKWRSRALVPSDFNNDLLDVSKSVVCEREMVPYSSGSSRPKDHTYFIIQHKAWFDVDMKNVKHRLRIVSNPRPSRVHHCVTFYIDDTRVVSFVIWPCSRNVLPVEYYRNNDKTKHFLLYLRCEEKNELRFLSEKTAVVRYLKKYPRALVNWNTVLRDSQGLQVRDTRYRLFLRDNVIKISVRKRVYYTTKQGFEEDRRRRRNAVLGLIAFQRLWKKRLYAPDRFFETEIYERIKQLRWNT